jgi:hypothetical protein
MSPTFRFPIALESFRPSTRRRRCSLAASRTTFCFVDGAENLEEEAAATNMGEYREMIIVATKRSGWRLIFRDRSTHG